MKRFLLIFIALYTCEQDNTSLLPNSSGNLNVISVVLNDELWKGSVGAALKNSFSKSIYGLPQREPMFSLKHIPIHVFSGFVTKGLSLIHI